MGGGTRCQATPQGTPQPALASGGLGTGDGAGRAWPGGSGCPGPWAWAMHKRRGLQSQGGRCPQAARAPSGEAGYRLTYLRGAHMRRAPGPQFPGLGPGAPVLRLEIHGGSRAPPRRCGQVTESGSQMLSPGAARDRQGDRATARGDGTPSLCLGCNLGTSKGRGRLLVGPGGLRGSDPQAETVSPGCRAHAA